MYSKETLRRLAEITLKAREIQYNTKTVKQPYSAEDEELERYNKNKNYFYTYHRGSWWYRNSQKQIARLLKGVVSGELSDEDVVIQKVTDRIATINNFTIIT